MTILPNGNRNNNREGVRCQKCLVFGHYTYECKGKQKFVRQASRTVRLNQRVKALEHSIAQAESDLVRVNTEVDGLYQQNSSSDSDSDSDSSSSSSSSSSLSSSDGSSSTISSSSSSLESDSSESSDESNAKKRKRVKTRDD